MTSEVFLHCAVMCSNGTDFEDTPPLLYYCAGGDWNYLKGVLSRYKNSNPWPNCSCKSFIIIFLLLPSAAQSPSIQRFIQLVSFFIRLKLRLSPTEFFFISLNGAFSWPNCLGNYFILVKMFQSACRKRRTKKKNLIPQQDSNL